MRDRLLHRSRPAIASLLTVAFAGALAAGAQPAGAQSLALRPCSADGRVLCGRLGVPLDRTGTVPGQISLSVRLVRAAGRSRGTVLFLAGGPGEGVTGLAPFLGDRRTSPLGSVLNNHDLLLLDQRGTGGSGLLRCPLVELTEAEDARPEIAACAQRLGPARDYYQTRDSVEDIDAVRAALGRSQLSIVGVSYGTKVAVDYARAHPGNVARLVLDSVVAPGGPDPLMRESIAATRRVLPALCAPLCSRINPDPVSDLRQLVAQIRQGGPLFGFAVGLDGARKALRIDRSGLLALLITGDLGVSPIFPQLPAALRSARQGDTGPLFRLEQIANAVELPTDPRAFSVALLLATTCTERSFPWSPSTPIGAREAEARQAVSALGEAPFDPFDAQTALETGTASLCESWPAPARPPAVATGPLPPVPALLLNGTRDVRTPLEAASATAAQLPGARLVAVGGTGHSTITSDFSGCAPRVMQRFFAGLPFGSCLRARPLLPPAGVAPTSMSQVPPAPGLSGRVGQTACAVGLTIDDAGGSLLGGSVTVTPGRVTLRAPGLRAGLIVVNVRLEPEPTATLDLQSYSYVRGVSVSGNPRRLARVYGPAAAPGAVRLQGNTLTGRLGGRPIRVNLTRCLNGGFGPTILIPASASSLASAALTPRLR